MRVEWPLTTINYGNYATRVAKLPYCNFHKHVSPRYRPLSTLRHWGTAPHHGHDGLAFAFERTSSMNPQYLRALPRAPVNLSTALRSSSRIPYEITRSYATQSDLGSGPRPKRRNITVLSDDGRYEWGELSGREKVSRATQQSVNFMVVIAGAVLTGGVFYLFWTEIVSPNSRTWQFEKAVDRIKEDSRCTKLLGDRRQIRAFGENTSSRWQRNRPIA
jgi:import inner membrane translocase subunit TIM21